MYNQDFFHKSQALLGLTKPDGYNGLALGGKTYGSGRPMPNIGSVSATGKQGYRQRDNMLAAKKQALLEFMQAGNRGAYASAPFLRGQK